MRLQLKINVEYDKESVQSVNKKSLVAFLEEIGNHASGNGLFTCDTPAEVNSWNMEVSEIKGDSSDPVINLSLVKQILFREDSCIDSKDVPKITDVIRKAIDLPPEYEDCPECYEGVIKISSKETLCDDCKEDE